MSTDEKRPLRSDPRGITEERARLSAPTANQVQGYLKATENTIRTLERDLKHYREKSEELNKEHASQFRMQTELQVQHLSRQYLENEIVFLQKEREELSNKVFTLVRENEKLKKDLAQYEGIDPGTNEAYEDLVWYLDTQIEHLESIITMFCEHMNFMKR